MILPMFDFVCAQCVRQSSCAHIDCRCGRRPGPYVRDGSSAQSDSRTVRPVAAESSSFSTRLSTEMYSARFCGGKAALMLRHVLACQLALCKSARGTRHAPLCPMCAGRRALWFRGANLRRRLLSDRYYCHVVSAISRPRAYARRSRRARGAICISVRLLPAVRYVDVPEFPEDGRVGLRRCHKTQKIDII